MQVPEVVGTLAPVFRYAAGVMSSLGYHVQTWRVPESHYFDYLSDSRNHAQVSLEGWAADYLTPSNFFGPFTCRERLRNSGENENISQFCDRAVDTGYDAALAAHGVEANARWTALDHRVAAAAPLIPLFNRRTVMLVSDRAGNAQVHLQLGPLLDQLWVR